MKIKKIAVISLVLIHILCLVSCNDEDKYDSNSDTISDSGIDIVFGTQTVENDKTEVTTETEVGIELPAIKVN